MVLFWTDILFGFLVLCLLFAIVKISRDEQEKQLWQSIFYRSKAMVAFVVLVFFAGIAILDSMHFMQDSQVYTALDKLLSPLTTQVEKTYSAPFADTLYNKEVQRLGDKSVLVYAPLTYGGQHLKASGMSKSQDIVSKVFRGLAIGLTIAAILSFLLAWLIAFCQNKNALIIYKHILTANTKVKWRAGLMTFALLATITAVCFSLLPYYHILGTDKVGNDVFYEAIKSIRTGLLIGTLTTLIMLPFAVLLGAIAGYFRGVCDDVIQYLYTTLASIPGVLLIAAAILSIQVYLERPGNFASIEQKADMKLLALCAILGLTSWTTLCRLIRAETLKLRQMDYIKAAQTFAVKPLKIIGKHIIPNVMHIIIITIILDFSGLVLAEAVLSYVGVGVDPTTYSWGNMINAARLEMAREPVVWWSLTAAFIFMFSLVLAANIFSDCVRDAFDPKHL